MCSDLKHLNGAGGEGVGGRGRQIDVKFDGNFYTITNPTTCDRVVACSVTMKRTYKMINEFLDSRSNAIPTSPLSRR